MAQKSGYFRTVFINHKKYTVYRVFNMVLNFEFIDKAGMVHLVDGEDVTEWNETENGKNTCTLDDAVEYARYYARETEDGIFYWKVRPQY